MVELANEWRRSTALSGEAVRVSGSPRSDADDFRESWGLDVVDAAEQASCGGLLPLDRLVGSGLEDYEMVVACVAERTGRGGPEYVANPIVAGARRGLSEAGREREQRDDDADRPDPLIRGLQELW